MAVNQDELKGLRKIRLFATLQLVGALAAIVGAILAVIAGAPGLIIGVSLVVIGVVLNLVSLFMVRGGLKIFTTLDASFGTPCRIITIGIALIVGVVLIVLYIFEPLLLGQVISVTPTSAATNPELLTGASFGIIDE